MEALWEIDQAAFRAIHIDLHSPLLNPIFWLLSYTGLGQVQFLLVLLLLKWQSTKYYVLPLLTTILVSGLIFAQGVKRLMPRDRPSNLQIAVPQEEFFAKSFPSGHTTTAFAAATMLLLMTYGSRQAWIGRVALAWATLVGLSRVYRGIHWPSDVLAGACVGALAACTVYLILRRLGKQLHLDQPSATISGQEVARESSGKSASVSSS